uniref:Uncharacterized protein n=1 Tax=Glossina morsitans morsitans TaxID=37546 RepID=A0A1B0GAF2_GLOMM
MCFKYSLLMGRGFGDIMSIKTFDSLSRRRKERSKRSHRKSPTSGRRVHKFRYREDASHSSSRRRHRDRAKDERDSGRNTRRSHSKKKEKKPVTRFEHQTPHHICPPPSRANSNSFANQLVLGGDLLFGRYCGDWIIDVYFQYQNQGSVS